MECVRLHSALSHRSRQTAAQPICELQDPIFVLVIVVRIGHVHARWTGHALILQRGTDESRYPHVSGDAPAQPKSDTPAARNSSAWYRCRSTAIPPGRGRATPRRYASGCPGGASVNGRVAHAVQLDTPSSVLARSRSCTPARSTSNRRANAMVCLLAKVVWHQRVPRSSARWQSGGSALEPAAQATRPNVAS